MKRVHIQESKQANKRTKSKNPVSVNDVNILLSNDPEYDPVSLAKTNAHPMDDRILFEEDTHTYRVRYTENFISDGITSVSTLIHSFFPHFEPDTIIPRMRKGRNFRHSKYVNMTNEEIKAMWTAAGQAASTKGTRLHYLLECHNNGYDLMNSPFASIPEVVSYFKWRKSCFEEMDLVPFRTEMRLCTDIDLRLTGTADLLAIKQNHPPPTETNGVLNLYLIDWKFSKEIKQKNQYEQGSGPCSHMDNCNYYHYLLQQNMYQWMLENFCLDWTWNGHTYNRVRIQERYLAIFHENHGPDGYMFITLPEQQDVVADIMRVRQKCIDDKYGFGCDSRDDFITIKK